MTVSLFFIQPYFLPSPKILQPLLDIFLQTSHIVNKMKKARQIATILNELVLQLRQRPDQAAPAHCGITPFA
jgi:hypothetical protein